MSTQPNREETLFHAALLVPPAERAAYLAKECAGDGALRQRVEGLLQAHEQAGEFLEQPPTEIAQPGVETPAPEGRIRFGAGGTQRMERATEKPGDTIGRYKLMEQIGEGGFGVVYVAEQREPVKRRVALKVIKLGMDTKDVVARFEAERQALAMMDHPNIAKVLDGGATDSGRPYFVMELVRGIPITKYCDENNLSIPQRLELFNLVCHALQHAHQKGIIHRDIKPSNILVTVNAGIPVPKVIDFGIAKATQGSLTDKTIYTQFEQFIGTPAYASPEQAEMSSLDIDTRSDIYSLGVLLYELLTGKVPFDPETLLEAGLNEMRRIIREEEPPKPSTRLSTLAEADQSTVAQRRQSSPVKLATLLRGDLDWIVMKALEKDRTRRYETANSFAQDIQRHLSNEPVLAGPPSPAYRIRKFARRNRVAVSIAAVVVVTLVAGICVALFTLKQTRRGSEQLRALLETVDPDGRMRAYAEERKQQALEDKKLKLETICTISGQGLTSRAQFSPAENTFAVITRKGAVLIFSTEGKQLRQLASPANKVTAISYAPDGKRLLAGTKKGTVLLWDLATGASREVFTRPDGTVGQVAWLANPERGVARYRDDKTNLATSGFVFRLTGGEALASFSTSGRGDYQSLSASLDGKKIAVLDIPGRERAGFLLDSDQCQVVAEFFDDDYPSGPLSIGIAPDNNTVVVGYGPYNMSLWDATQQKELRLLKAHSNWVVSLAFSPNSKRLISGAGDSTARIWEVASGREIGRLRFDGESTYVQSVGFSPDGQLVLAAAENDVVIVAKAPK